MRWSEEILAMPVISLEQTDQDLIALSLAGNQKAFRQLLIRHGPLVYQFILKKVQAAPLAEDLAQEVFIKVFQNLKQFDQKRSFKPWLLRIALNTTISYHRKCEVRLQTISLTELESTNPGMDWIDASCNVESDVTQRLVSEATQACIRQLEDRYREPLQLHYMEDKSYSEISKTQHIPLNTIKTWVKRGTTLLQEKLKGLWKP